MKTIEEKAKAYDEALERARKLYNSEETSADVEIACETIFPELAESKDEKIRKVQLDYWRSVDGKEWYGVPVQEVIAWLEKQGEQKLTKEKMITPEESLGIDSETYNKIVDECIYGEQKSADKVEPKFKVKYANSEYNVLEIKDIAGVTFYGIEDEPNHIDYVKAENCDIISVYAIKENGSPYPTKPAVFSEKKPKRMISAEAKECIYGSDNEQVSSEKIGKNDTLLDLLNKMPSCITVDGIDYHFVMKKTVTFMAFYEGEGGEGRDKIIFWMAGDPIAMLTAMLEKLKKEGLLE